MISDFKSDLLQNIKSDVAPETLKGVANKEFNRGLKKGNLLYFSIVHICGLYGLYLILIGAAKWGTIALAILLYYISILGITAGAHRLWSHRSYKATRPLEILLITMNTIAFQFSAITWVRDHRNHHKYSETDGDPYNLNRGLFFSHIGWVLSQKHPDVKKGGKKIDLSDVYNNPVLRFQHSFVLCVDGHQNNSSGLNSKFYDNTYYNVLAGLGCHILPALLPLVWGEAFSVAWCLNQARYMMSLHAIFLINSAAHKWGNRPYDRSIAPSQHLGTTIASLGEGFHNYHHSFPFDYRAAELGDNILNPTTRFIDFFVWLGWAYDTRTASPEMVKDRAKRTGDGSFLSY